MILVVFSVFAMFTASSLAAQEDIADMTERMGSGNFITGKEKSRTELCQECHGEQGNATGVGVPHLAGQFADYILKQLHNFKSGERKHPVMNPMAQGLAAEDMGDIAAYFGSNRLMQGSGSKASGAGWNLFNRGDIRRNILACKSCHGEYGKGRISAYDIFPAIGGQRKLYLREQLLNWRSGSRSNSPDNIMNIITHALSDDEIEALSEYISGL